MKQKMKQAICHKYHKDLGGKVPEDALEVTCYKCSEAEHKTRDKAKHNA